MSLFYLALSYLSLTRADRVCALLCWFFAGHLSLFPAAVEVTCLSIYYQSELFFVCRFTEGREIAALTFELSVSVCVFPALLLSPIHFKGTPPQDFTFLATFPSRIPCLFLLKQIFAAKKSLSENTSCTRACLSVFCRLFVCFACLFSCTFFSFIEKAC